MSIITLQRKIAESGRRAPDKFLFLGRLLGYEVPEGVLE